MKVVKGGGPSSFFSIREKRPTSGALIREGHLLFEKCDLLGASKCFLIAIDLAKKEKNTRALGEALSGQLWASAEALDEPGIQAWEKSLNEWIQAHPQDVAPMVWYAQGAVCFFRKDYIKAQRWFLRYLRALRKEKDRQPSAETHTKAAIAEAKGYIMIANCLLCRKRLGLSERLVKWTLTQFESQKLPSINGILYMMVGSLNEKRGDFAQAWEWFKKAQSTFLGEHNWYYHLYVLLAYARISRATKHYARAEWYLEILIEATKAPEFGVLRREIQDLKNKMEKTSPDLTIDAQKGVVQTKQGGLISLRKQYVLLDILKALAKAHKKSHDDAKETVIGLSKGEIIEKVWKEHYRPEAHDNKLYYNINRLRKLIEPDLKVPQYLQNWREGYRFSPGLRVELIDIQIQQKESE